MFPYRTYDDMLGQADQIAKLRHGRIVTRGGRWVHVEKHFIRSPVSIAQIWWESKRGSLRGDVCLLDYHVPRGLPQFLTLDYIRSGCSSSYKTFLTATLVLDEIARVRQSVAIVAHVSNSNISDRLLRRLGWERHLETWSGRHWIKRFYDGYPTSRLEPRGQ